MAIRLPPDNDPAYQWTQPIRDSIARVNTLDLGVLAPVTVSYAASVTLNATQGSLFRVTATGDLTVADITGGVNGQQIVLEVLASGASRSLTVAGSSVTIPSGQWWTSSARFNSGTGNWLLDDGSGGSAGDFQAALDALSARVAALEAAGGGSTPTVPGAPTIGSATAGNGQASVAFTAPTSNGGATITGYTVTSTPGSLTATGSSSPITVTGLTNGTAYTFKVKATNSVGTGAESAASNSATPAASGPTPIGLVDDFTTQDNTKWDYQTAASVSGGQLRCVSNGAFTGEVRSDNAYDFTGKSFYFELVQASADGETYASVWHTGPSTNALGWNITGGNLVAVSRAAGGYNEVQTATYNATSHRWLRISESGGTVTWATSANGTTWATFTTLAVPITITALRVQMGCGGGTTGTAIFDNVNTTSGGGGGSSPVTATVGAGRVDTDTIAA